MRCTRCRPCITPAGGRLPGVVTCACCGHATRSTSTSVAKRDTANSLSTTGFRSYAAGRAGQAHAAVAEQGAYAAQPAPGNSAAHLPPACGCGSGRIWVGSMQPQGQRDTRAAHPAPCWQLQTLLHASRHSSWRNGLDAGADRGHQQQHQAGLLLRIHTSMLQGWVMLAAHGTAACAGEARACGCMLTPM